jgi:hypothetical protein
MKMSHLRRTLLLLGMVSALLYPVMAVAQGAQPEGPGDVPPPDLSPGEYLSFIWYEMTGQWLDFTVIDVSETQSVQWEGPTRYWLARDGHGNLHVIYVGDYNAIFDEGTEQAEGIVLEDMWGSVGNSINAYWCLLTGLCGDEPPDWPNWIWMPEVEFSSIVIPHLSGGVPAPAGTALAPEPQEPPPGPGPLPGTITDDPDVRIDFGDEVLNPVVVEQDQEARGADIFLIVRVPPVIYTYELEQQEERCIHSETPPPDWHGCDLDTDGDGSPDHPGDPYWNEDGESLWVTRDQPVADALLLTPGAWQFKAILSDQSRAWIMGELRSHYPYAVVVHPEWDLTQTEYFELVDAYIDGDRQAIVRMQATYVPFVDPGVYDVVAMFRTEGTEFVCPGTCRNVRVSIGGRTLTVTRTEPRLLEAHRDLKVWMHDARLVR